MKKNILIIGAGISGLYLAYLLEKKYNITILEARERIGGRIYSVDSHDMGPSWIWQHHQSILALVQELGLELFSQHTEGYALYDTKAKVERFTTPPALPSVRMNGSLTQLVEALYERLENTQLHYSQEVFKIQQNEKNILVETKTKLYNADYVISTLPPRLASKLHYSPVLPDDLLYKFQTTQTWMGHSAKCVIEFEESFWRKESLSGFVFSHIGPLGEVHDASIKDRAALFGFVQSNANMKSFEEDVQAQITRLFGNSASKIMAIHLVDWRKEQYSATGEDAKPLGAHPEYGIDTSKYSNKVLFSATEFSHEQGGYLEGAIIRAQEIAKSLL